MERRPYVPRVNSCLSAPTYATCVCVTSVGLTCSDHSLDFDAGGVQLLGKLMDGPAGVLVGFGVDVGFGAWKFNCRKVRGLLLRLNMRVVSKGFSHTGKSWGREMKKSCEEFGRGGFMRLSVSAHLPAAHTTSAVINPPRVYIPAVLAHALITISHDISLNYKYELTGSR